MPSNTPISSTDAMKLTILWRGMGKSNSQIIEMLVERGLSQLDAQLAVDKVNALQSQAVEHHKKEQNNVANVNIIIGLVFLFGGLAVMFISFGSGGGLLPWGAIVFGIIEIVIGATQRERG
jgi:hypothetical protein